jgi:hypothetical protein
MGLLKLAESTSEPLARCDSETITPLRTSISDQQIRRNADAKPFRRLSARPQGIIGLDGRSVRARSGSAAGELEPLARQTRVHIETLMGRFYLFHILVGMIRKAGLIA